MQFNLHTQGSQLHYCNTQSGASLNFKLKAVIWISGEFGTLVVLVCHATAMAIAGQRVTTHFAKKVEKKKDVVDDAEVPRCRIRKDSILGLHHQSQDYCCGL